MSINNRNTIYNALPIVAAAYGEKFGVKVKIGNDMAHTDGKTIVVPNVPADYPNMDVVWGYLAHEAAHVRWTDFSAPRRPGLHAELTNVFEDCRIEREMMALYPGTTKTLNDVASYMAQAGHYTHLTDNAHPAQIIIGYSLYWLQARAVGQGAINPFLESSQAVLQRVMPKGMVTRLNVLLRKVVDTKSTQEVCALADEVIRMIEDEQQKAANKQKQEDKS